MYSRVYKPIVIHWGTEVSLRYIKLWLNVKLWLILNYAILNCVFLVFLVFFYRAFCSKPYNKYFFKCIIKYL